MTDATTTTTTTNTMPPDTTTIYVDPSRPKVEVTMTITAVDYTALTGDAALLDRFTQNLKQTIAQEAGHGVQPSHVTLTLSAGSVQVKAEIAMPTGVEASTVQNTISQSTSLQTAVVSSVNSVSGINTVTTGTVGVTNVGAVVRAPTTTTSTTRDYTASSDGGVVSGAQGESFYSPVLAALVAVWLVH